MNQRQKVLWAVSTIGTGHVYRSVAISEELARLVGPLDIIFVSGAAAYEVLRAERLKCLEGLIPVKVPVRDGYLNTMAFVRDWISKEEQNAGMFYQLVNHYQPSLVVADELPSLTSVAHGLGVPSALVTDFFFIETTKPFTRNLLFNTLLAVVGPLVQPLVRHGYEQIERIIFADHLTRLHGRWREWAKRHAQAVGPIVRPRKGTVDVRGELGIDPNQRLIIVTVGGSAAGTYLLETAIRAFPQIKAAVPEAAMLLVLGPSISQRALPPVSTPGFFVRQHVPDLIEYLAACDLAVCTSGHSTLNEIALRARVPTITCPIGNHWEQIGNALQAQKVGYARMIERHKLTPAGLAQEVVTILTNRSLSEQMSRAAHSVVELDGASRAAVALASLLARRDQTEERITVPPVYL